MQKGKFFNMFMGIFFISLVYNTHNHKKPHNLNINNYNNHHSGVGTSGRTNINYDSKLTTQEKYDKIIDEQNKKANRNKDTDKVYIDAGDGVNKLSYLFDVSYNYYSKSDKDFKNYTFRASGNTSQKYNLGSENSDSIVSGNGGHIMTDNIFEDIKVHMPYNEQGNSHVNFYTPGLKHEIMLYHAMGLINYFTIKATGILTCPSIELLANIGGKDYSVGTFGQYNFWKNDYKWAVPLIVFAGSVTMVAVVFAGTIAVASLDWSSISDLVENIYQGIKNRFTLNQNVDDNSDIYPVTAHNPINTSAEGSPNLVSFSHPTLNPQIHNDLSNSVASARSTNFGDGIENNVKVEVDNDKDLDSSISEQDDIDSLTLGRERSWESTRESRELSIPTSESNGSSRSANEVTKDILLYDRSFLTNYSSSTPVNTTYYFDESDGVTDITSPTKSANNVEIIEFDFPFATSNLEEIGYSDFVDSVEPELHDKIEPQILSNNSEEDFVVITEVLENNIVLNNKGYVHNIGWTDDEELLGYKPPSSTIRYEIDSDSDSESEYDSYLEDHTYIDDYEPVISNTLMFDDFNSKKISEAIESSSIKPIKHEFIDRWTNIFVKLYSSNEEIKIYNPLYQGDINDGINSDILNDTGDNINSNLTLILKRNPSYNNFTNKIDKIKIYMDSINDTAAQDFLTLHDEILTNINFYFLNFNKQILDKFKIEATLDVNDVDITPFLFIDDLSNRYKQILELSKNIENDNVKINECVNSMNNISASYHFLLESQASELSRITSGIEENYTLYNEYTQSLGQACIDFNEKLEELNNIMTRTNENLKSLKSLYEDFYSEWFNDVKITSENIDTVISDTIDFFKNPNVTLSSEPEVVETESDVLVPFSFDDELESLFKDEMKIIFENNSKILSLNIIRSRFTIPSTEESFSDYPEIVEYLFDDFAAGRESIKSGLLADSNIRSQYWNILNYYNEIVNKFTRTLDHDDLLFALFAKRALSNFKTRIIDEFDKVELRGAPRFIYLD